MSSIRVQLGAAKSSHFEKYLSMLTTIGQSWRNAFEGLRSKMWRGVKGRKEMTLSLAGIEI